MKKIKHLKNKILGLALAFVAPFSALGGVMLAGGQAIAADVQYLPSWSSGQIANDFLDSPSFVISGSSQPTPLYGWDLIDGASPTSTGMIIDVGNSFTAQRMKEYFLTKNPGTPNESYNNENTENDILMINSLNTLVEEDYQKLSQAKRGYSSNEFTLEANSFYRLSVAAKTSLEGRTDIDGAYASIYLSGLKDNDGKDVKMAFEGVYGAWKRYYFFVATGDQAQNVTLDLFLGRSRTDGSYGVAFFDDVNIEEYSENAFMSTAQLYGYDFADNNTAASGGTVRFLVNGLKKSSFPLMARDDYKNANLDFESKDKELNGLTSQWKIVGNHPNAHAQIFDVQNSGLTGFENTTGYDFVGNDLSYNNTQALALYSTKGKEGNIVLENTTPITVEAHAVYKISMKVKFSGTMTGSFYVNLVESESKNNEFEARTGASSGLSSNKDDNAATNGYFDLTYFVSGRSLYDSQVKLQLALGSDAGAANGCVLVDNIKIDYATSAEAEEADNYLNLQGDEEVEYSSIKNNAFDEAVVTDADEIYPLSAKNWTLEQEEGHADDVVAGVVYLLDQDKYEDMYSGKYDWATSYPGSVNGKDKPNNAFMFHNGSKSYQSIKSESYTLSANGYYKLDFNYYNLDDTQLTVELVDENGIVLFKEPIANSFNSWNKNSPVNIAIHTPLTSSHEVSVIVHFGTEQEPVRGTSYVDNFALTSSSAAEFGSASLKVDMTDYMLNLAPDKTLGKGISSSTAYTFKVDSGDSNAAEGGILNGESNEHGVKFVGSDGKAKNILAITSRISPNTSSIVSNFPFSLSNGYYKLSFAVKTNIVQRPNTDQSQDEGHECKYGITAGLTNFSMPEGLLSAATSESENDGDENENAGWTTYTLYFDASDKTSESNLQFTLVMDEHFEGSAYLTDIVFESINEDQYKFGVSDENPDKATAFAATYLQADEDEDVPPADDDESGAGEFNAANWLVIPSLITALAVLIGIVGWALRHVKIKKIEKVKQESYDRKVSLNQDAILAAATAERDKQAEQIKANIATMEEQKQILEDEHKLAIKDARLSNRGKITKETEKEFKSYATRLTRLEQKIDILREQLEKIESADYLISLQRQFAADETRRQKEALSQKQKEKK